MIIITITICYKESTEMISIIKNLKGVNKSNIKYFEVFSDVSFTDNILNRKSSQGYLLILFGGPVL